MRSSLQKMRPSGLSSRPASLPPGELVAVGGARPRGPRRNGAVPGARVGVSVGDDEQVHARLRLLEGYVGRTQMAECAQFSLQWLADTAGVSRSICLVKPIGEQTLAAVAAQGLDASGAASLSVSLDD